MLEAGSMRGAGGFIFELKILNSKNRSSYSNDQVMNVMWPNGELSRQCMVTMSLGNYYTIIVSSWSVYSASTAAFG